MSKVHTNHRAASVPSLPRISSRPILATLLAVLAGCHRAPRGASSSAELEGVIGDSSAFGARITHLDRLRKRAFVTLTSPAYVVLLSVSPGRSIDPLWVDSAQTPALTGAASQMIAWRDPADTVGAGGRNEASPPVVPLPVQAEIDRCVRERTAAVERARARPRTRPRPVVRDSSGRAVPQPVEPRGVETGADDSRTHRQIEADCRKQFGSRPGSAQADTHDRYIVLIASSAPMSVAEITARLAILTVTAEDARTTIFAIGDGLYFDRQAIWSGYYVRW